MARVPHRWFCVASAAPCHHGCRAGMCGLKIHQIEWSDTFCLLFYLDCGQKFQPLGFGETMPSLQFQDHSNSQSRETVVLNSHSFPLYKVVSLWTNQKPMRGFPRPGPRVGETEGRESHLGPAAGGPPVHKGQAYKRSEWENLAPGRRFPFFYSEKVEFTGILRGWGNFKSSQQTPLRAGYGTSSGKV